MTTPEDQKAAQCPFCGSAALTTDGSQGPKACCADRDCDLSEQWIDLDQWNTRPREQELEEELAAANEYNDTDKSLSEVMAAISDAVMDFHPDVESASAGTLIERVETAAELARKASERERRLEGVLREAKEFAEKGAAERVSYEAKNTMSGDWETVVTDEPTIRAYQSHTLLSAINAALEEKR